MTAPNLEERLSAAAFTILTDENRHARQAQRWAVRFLRTATKGGSTAFQRHIRTARAHAFAGRLQ